MEPTQVDLTIYQGATFRRTVVWLTGEPPTPVDLTGYTARMQIRRKLKDRDFVIELTTENGRISITRPDEGLINLLISATDTAALSILSGVYDLELEYDDEVVRLIEGAVTISPEVTRNG